MQCGQLKTKLHYLHCTDTKITTTREKHTTLLVKQMKALNSYPGIITAVTKILKNGYNWNWNSDINTNNQTDRLLVQAIASQQTRGPHSLPLGYLSLEWPKVQAQWLLDSNGSPSSHHWMKEIVTILHTNTYSAWKSRNDVLHNDAEKPLKVLRRRKLQERTIELYGRGRANLQPRELTYFKLPIEQRLKKGTESLSLWIKLA